MQFLIDGYNLMHAAGYLTSRSSGRLAPIRTRFLDWLASVARNKSAVLTVVFDGANSARPASADHRGVQVRFSAGRTADDEIECRLNGSGAIVVSNDARLHEATRRARIEAWRCERFLDWVIGSDEQPRVVRTEPEKPERGPEDDELLSAFRLP